MKRCWFAMLKCLRIQEQFLSNFLTSLFQIIADSCPNNIESWSKQRDAIVIKARSFALRTQPDINIKFLWFIYLLYKKREENHYTN